MDYRGGCPELIELVVASSLVETAWAGGAAGADAAAWRIEPAATRCSFTRPRRCPTPATCRACSLERSCCSCAACGAAGGTCMPHTSRWPTTFGAASTAPRCRSAGGERGGLGGQRALFGQAACVGWCEMSCCGKDKLDCCQCISVGPAAACHSGPNALLPLATSAGRPPGRGEAAAALAAARGGGACRREQQRWDNQRHRQQLSRQRQWQRRSTCSATQPAGVF